MFAAPIAAISTDFSNLVKSFVTAVFWLSGVLFQVDTMHKGLAHKLLMLNPVTFLCNGYRNCFIYHTWFFDQPKRLLYFAVWLVVIYTRHLELPPHPQRNGGRTVRRAKA